VSALRRLLTPRILVGVAIAAALCLGSRPARADTADSCATSAESAETLMRSHRWSLARPELVACAREACPRVVRKDCVAWLAEVDDRTPTVVVRATDSRGRDVVGARLLVDGALVAAGLDGTARPLDPGKHVLRLEISGAAPVSQEILAAEGEHARLVSMTFAAPLTAEGASDAARPAPTERAAAPSVTPAYVLAGVGLVALGAFAVLDATTYSDYRSAESGCGQTGSCSPSTTSSLRARFDAAAVLLGVGVASVALGGGLFLHARLEHGGAAGVVGMRF
jgi:hypothetical protein